MTISKEFVIGCCAVVLDRPLFARFNLLQIVAQTVRPNFYAIVATGEEFDRRFIEDLVDETMLLMCIPEPTTTLAAYTLGLEQLFKRGVNLFFCVDHDCVYKRSYIERVCNFIASSGFDVTDGQFCLNLIDQEWITLFDDARAEMESQSFRTGFGLSEREAQEMVVGAPPTFVFGRQAAEAIIQHQRQGEAAVSGYHDMVWRRALLDSGIPITQVQTPEPIFAYVRHRNNLCWGAAPVRPPRERHRINSVGVRAVMAPNRQSRQKSSTGQTPAEVDVTVVIPTFNEGGWLKRTVGSILQARTALRYEIVVVDDGCTDGSVDAIARADRVRIVKTQGEQLGVVVAKNTGAKAAQGKYLCFADSHVIVPDHWLDYLRETCDDYPESLVSGNLPDVANFTSTAVLDQNQYGYIVRNCMLGTGWHFYGRAFTDQPYFEPLTPGGLMFTRKAHFARLDGFASVLRKWGAEDIQISLQNYYLGGENLVDPRVVVYHQYKNSPANRRTFTITNEQHAFNCLHVAAVYFPYEYYINVRAALAPRGATNAVIAEIESEEHQAVVKKTRREFVRGFDAWTEQFKTELRKFLEDAEQRSQSGEQLAAISAGA
jgi:glycosyltransferase involved in cell wall biosynthesis